MYVLGYFMFYGVGFVIYLMLTSCTLLDSLTIADIDIHETEICTELEKDLEGYCVTSQSKRETSYFGDSWLDKKQGMLMITPEDFTKLVVPLKTFCDTSQRCEFHLKDNSGDVYVN